MKKGISEPKIRNLCAKLARIKEVMYEKKGNKEKLNINDGNALYNYLRDNKFTEQVTDDIRVGKSILSKDEVKIILVYKIKDEHKTENEHKFTINIHLLEALTL